MSMQSLMPNRTERIIRARNDLAMGMPYFLTQGADGVIAAALETVGQDRFDAIKQALGTPTLIISSHRARAVMSAAAATNLGSVSVRICPPEGADFQWYQRLADPKFDCNADAIGPLHVLHTSDTTLQNAGLGLVKAAQLIPAFVLFPIDHDNPLLHDLGLVPLDANEALAELEKETSLELVAAARLPLEAHQHNRLHVFHEPDGQRQHYAVEVGTPNRAKPVLVRLHSACFTGDVLGSLKCDCGPQLRSALARMGEEGAGVLLYLNQEGRGIGLANKMRVYGLQDLGFDTVEANHQLGFDDDERDFRLAATMLKTLGFASVRLLTNNPRKVDRLEKGGVTVVERLPSRVGETAHNHDYLSVKALKSGHFL